MDQGVFLLRCMPSWVKILGAVVALIGLVILLCAIPGWLWLAVLGLALIAAGLYLFLACRR